MSGTHSQKQDFDTTPDGLEEDRSIKSYQLKNNKFKSGRVKKMGIMERYVETRQLRNSVRAPTLGDDITRKTKSDNIKSEQHRRKNSDNMGKKFGQLFFKHDMSRSNPMISEIGGYASNATSKD